MHTAYNLSLYGGPPRVFQQLSVHPTVFRAHFEHPFGRALTHDTGLFFSLAMATKESAQALFFLTLLLAGDFACTGNVTNRYKSAAMRMSGCYHSVLRISGCYRPCAIIYGSCE